MKTLIEKQRIVYEHHFDEYQEEMSKNGLQYISRNNMRVKGKRVGIQRLVNAQKYAAARVYDRHYKD